MITTVVHYLFYGLLIFTFVKDGLNNVLLRNNFSRYYLSVSTSNYSYILVHGWFKLVFLRNIIFVTNFHHIFAFFLPISSSTFTCSTRKAASFQEQPIYFYGFFTISNIHFNIWKKPYRILKNRPVHRDTTTIFFHPDFFPENCFKLNYPFFICKYFELFFTAIWNKNLIKCIKRWNPKKTMGWRYEMKQ